MKGTIQTTTHDADETRALGESFAHILRAGDTVALRGELGSGKTVFVQGVCCGLGYHGSVTSPTFTLVHEYPAHLPICHFDCFRVRNIREISTTGFEDYLGSAGIMLVEWAENIKDFFNQWSWEIRFNFVQNEENHRQISISCPLQADSDRRLRQLCRILAGIVEVPS